MNRNGNEYLPLIFSLYSFGETERDRLCVRGGGLELSEEGEDDVRGSPIEGFHRVVRMSRKVSPLDEELPAVISPSDEKQTRPRTYHTIN